MFYFHGTENSLFGIVRIVIEEIERLNEYKSKLSAN